MAKFWKISLLILSLSHFSFSNCVLVWPDAQNMPVGPNDTISTIALNSLRQGAANGLSRGIGNAVGNTLSSGINFIPIMFKRVSLVIAAYLHRLSCGNQGLNASIININLQEITRVINPLTIKSHGNNDKVKRMLDINQEMNNELQDIHWQKMQDSILRVLDHVKSLLMQSIPCYSLELNPATGVRRFIAYCSSFLTLQDNELIRQGIAAAIKDIIVLRSYINEFKSWKDVEQNIEHTKRWLQLIQGDFKYISALLEGEVAQNNFRAPSIVNSAGQSMSHEQLSDIFSNFQN